MLFRSAYFSMSNQPSSRPAASIRYVCSPVRSPDNFRPPLRSPNRFHAPIHFCSLRHSCSLLGVPSTFRLPLRVRVLPLITPPIACPLSHALPLIRPILRTPCSLFTHVAPLFHSFKFILYITRRPTLTPRSHPQSLIRFTLQIQLHRMPFYDHSCTLGPSVLGRDCAVFHFITPLFLSGLFV